MNEMLDSIEMYLRKMLGMDVVSNTPHMPPATPAEGDSGGLLGGQDPAIGPVPSRNDIASAEATEETSAKQGWAQFLGGGEADANSAAILRGGMQGAQAPSLNMSPAALPEYQRQKRTQLATTLKELIGGLG